MDCYISLVDNIISNYIEINNIDKNIASKITLHIVDSIVDEINNIDQDLLTELNINYINECDGYTVFIEDKSIIILNKRLLKNSIKDFIWIEVIIHEYTHAIDYLSNLGLFGYEKPNEMLKCMPFWYWSEFHARYNGNVFMLKFITEMPQEEQIKYIDIIYKGIDSYYEYIKANKENQMKIYKTMHIIADIIAFEEFYPSEINGIIKDLKKTFKQVINFKEYMLRFKYGFDRDEILQLPNVCSDFVNDKLLH